MSYAKRLSRREMLAALPSPPASARMIGRNTLEHYNAGVRCVIFHQTTILRFPARGGFEIDTGGWNTTTTRDRINRSLPPGWRIYTEQGTLYLHDYNFRAPVPFHQHIRVLAPRHPVLGGTIKSDFSFSRANKLKKLIDAYIGLYRQHGLPPASESEGDPWILGAGKTKPDVMLDWIKTRYRHRRLFALALAYAGLSDTGISLFHDQVDRASGKLDGLHLRRLRRYVRASLGLAS